MDSQLKPSCRWFDSESPLKGFWIMYRSLESLTTTVYMKRENGKAAKYALSDTIMEIVNANLLKD